MMNNTIVANWPFADEVTDNASRVIICLATRLIRLLLHTHTHTHTHTHIISDKIINCLTGFDSR